MALADGSIGYHRGGHDRDSRFCVLTVCSRYEQYAEGTIRWAEMLRFTIMHASGGYRRPHAGFSLQRLFALTRTARFFAALGLLAAVYAKGCIYC